MKLAKSDLLAALRLRYDHYSATSIFEATLARANLPDQDAYDEKQIATFRSALARVGDRLQNVELRIDALLAEPATAKPEPAAKPEPEPAVKPAPAKPAPPPIAPGIHEVEATPPVETTITLAGIDVKDGEQVLVCGETDVLGDWNPEKAPAMKREGAYFLAKVRVPPGTELPFKFLRKTADGAVIWEDGENRQLAPKPRIEATWRST